MTTSSRSIFGDRELFDMLLGEPELLAIADAIVATAAVPATAVAPRLHARRRLPKARRIALSIAAATAAVVTLLLVAPWNGRPTLTDRALAAIGDQPVLHVAIADLTSDDTLYDVSTGRRVARERETEIWFDRQRDLKKTVFGLGGQVLGEQLDTREGSWTQTGRVYTCAWIASHPSEARDAGVTCGQGGNNGTGSNRASEPSPTLDPAIAGFVDRYQSALVAGEAHKVSTGEVSGQEVIWLEFDVGGIAEQVAVDANTYLPVILKAQGGRTTFRVLFAGSGPYVAALFDRPKRILAQTSGARESTRPVDNAVAPRVLQRDLLWLGEQWGDLRLAEVTAETWTSSFGSSSTVQQIPVVHFHYVRSDTGGALHGGGRSVDLYEAATCLVGVGWTCTPRDPTTVGTLGREGAISLLRADRLYVSIWNWSSPKEPDPLLLAQALHRLPLR